MEESVTVITNPTVSVRLTSTISSFEAVRRFNRGITVAEFKTKLEMITGCPPASMMLQLFSTSDKFLLNLDSDESLLGSYPIDDDCRIHVIDRSGTLTGAFSDLSEVEKYEISEDAYEKRADSLRNFKKNMNVRHLMEENVAKHQESLLQKEEDERAALASIAVGKRCQTHVPGQPTKTGTIMFVGTTDFKPGTWVGVKYDEPLGKNDGSFNGKRYFECELKYGAFVRPLTVTVGDFPEEDYGLDEM